MYTVQIQTYSINTAFLHLRKAAGIYGHYTFYLHLQQNPSHKKLFSLPSRPRNVSFKKSNTWVFVKYNFASRL